MYGWVRRETGGKFALEIRRLWGFDSDPAAAHRRRSISRHPINLGNIAGSAINPPDSKHVEPLVFGIARRFIHLRRVIASTPSAPDEAVFICRALPPACPP
jgi:hypothetical protein